MKNLTEQYRITTHKEGACPTCAKRLWDGDTGFQIRHRDGFLLKVGFCSQRCASAGWLD